MSITQRTEKPESSRFRAALRRWGPLALVVAAAIAVYALGLNRYVSPHFLKERHDALKAFVDAHWWPSLIVFTLFFALITTTAVPGAVFAQLAGGFLFGALAGGISIALAATTGALAIYFVTRSAFGDGWRRRLETDTGALARMKAGLDRNSFWFLLGLRLAPVVPFVFVNIASGLAGVPLRRYVLATFIGTFPTNFVYAAIGAGMDKLFAQGREPDMSMVLDLKVLAPLSALAALSLLPIVVRFAWARWQARRMAS